MYYLEVASQPVVQPHLPTNTYALNITYMHGDADHYSDTEHKRSDITEALEIVTLWMKWNELDWNYRCDLLQSDKKISATLREFGIPDPDNMIDGLFERDITNDNSFAHFDQLSIFWYDEKGIKYPVNVLTNKDSKVII